MNAVEIESALSQLFEAPIQREEFFWQFLAAFGNNDTTIKRLKKGDTNATDIALEGVSALLQRNNIHLALCQSGQVTATLDALRASPATLKAKAKFILATDGEWIEAEELASGEVMASEYRDFPIHFGMFLPLAGITTTREIKENPIDVRATGRLNKLYLELIKDNPEWASEARQHDMNHFMARLIFCFFAEDTQILRDSVFTNTVEQMSDRDGTNTTQVIHEIFRAMNIEDKGNRRKEAQLPNWTLDFPYVNGGLFGDAMDMPVFSRLSRSYLISAGRLNWKEINPDIFGSMIQAVTEESERAALGMHYTSVPNILKVLNPLFLDDLRAELERAGDSPVKLLNLRKRMAKIRIFDPACGSGNFLVIAYKQMREIEAEINRRRSEPDRKSEIPLTNFRGIEIRDFPAEIARLALVIAEYQCDELYRGQNLALAEFLPLKKENWIRCGNALREDWLAVCPPAKNPVQSVAEDLFETPLEQPRFDFDNEGGETYLCGNPPYLGSTWQDASQKDDLKKIFDKRCKNWKSLDYVAGWFMKAADYAKANPAPTTAAFVSTNSICQGQQVPILWPLIFGAGLQIEFAYTSFKWANLASHNAGVTVNIVGIGNRNPKIKKIFNVKSDDDIQVKEVENINAYLIGGANVIVEKANELISKINKMDRGNGPVDGGNFFFNGNLFRQLKRDFPDSYKYIRKYSNSEEFINGKQRYCLWLNNENKDEAMRIPEINKRIDNVRVMRLASTKKQTQQEASTPFLFSEIRHRESHHSIVVPRVSSENRPNLPVGVLEGSTIIGDRNFALYDAPLWNMALIASRLHWVWIGTVCVRMRTDFSYSNTLGWNTFPVPKLTEQNKNDLTRAAENILLAREAHFPATIADLYDPDTMPADLRAAHDRNDEIIERIYIGRRFKNDSERLEKLFDLYTRMTSKAVVKKAP